MFSALAPPSISDGCTALISYGAPYAFMTLVMWSNCDHLGRSSIGMSNAGMKHDHVCCVLGALCCYGCAATHRSRLTTSQQQMIHCRCIAGQKQLAL